MIRSKQLTLAVAGGLLLMVGSGAFASMMSGASAPSNGLSAPGSGAADPTLVFSLDLLGNDAIATLNGTALGGGEFWATSGTLNVTSGADAGTYSLFAGGPGVFNAVQGTSGYEFQADNVLYSGADPYLDEYGLLFAGGGTDINIWGNSADNYSFYSYNGSTFNVEATGTPTSVSLTVPEPGTLALLAMGLAALGVSLTARRRKLS
jgi:hypothetical protein